MTSVTICTDVVDLVDDLSDSETFARLLVAIDDRYGGRLDGWANDVAEHDCASLCRVIQALHVAIDPLPADTGEG